MATPSTNDDPITLYRPHPQAPFTILLSARDQYWCQYAYQFSHELCHVLSDYERLRENPNNWFHEAICELASVFTLRRMAERWLTCPPYPGRADYAKSLASYADDLLCRENRQLPAGTTIARWLSTEEDTLREASLKTEFGEFSKSDRDKIAVVSHALLPLFESEPTGWNSVCKVPATKGPFTEYLSDWHNCVEPADKLFVERILNLFGQTS